MSALLAAATIVVIAVVCRPRAARGFRPDASRVPVRQRSPRARAQQIQADLPHATELVVLAVRAGLLPIAALTAAAAHLGPPISGAFHDVADRVARGQRFADAVGALTSQLGPAAAPLADSFAAADRYGLPLAPVLERLGDEARQRRRRSADTLARQLPVRLAVPLVVCTLPSFFLLAIVPLLLAALTSLHR